MKADIITIGDEILIGQITDTNSQWIAEKINLSAYEIRQITTVGDNKEQIKNCLDNVIPNTDLVIITGGLGPTEDDITKETLADYFGMKLVLNYDVLSDVQSFVNSKGFKMNELNKKQAEVPEHCKILRNKNGTAPGMWFEKEQTIIISLPAVPFEMKEILKNCVLPELQVLNKDKESKIVHKTVLVYGYPESELAELLSDWESKLYNKIKLAYLPSPERIRLRLSIICDSEEKALSIIEDEVNKLKKILGYHIFGYGDTFMQNVIGELLVNREKTLSVAESCTSGNIARLITSVPGSSMYFKGGIVAYSNEIKNKMLNVSESTLQSYGAVSEEVVKEMAVGQRNLFKTDYAVAVSGIAGPGGGTIDKPVGTTWIAIADTYGVSAFKFNFGNRRELNVRFASTKALDLLRLRILSRS
jgi:nicotinamide-nucleotide amidase